MEANIALVLAGYCAGSIACAVLVCRAMGLPDPRQGGSGNPGATNVLRLGGRKAALFTLVGDYLKGLLPVIFAAAVGASDIILAATGLAAFLGHLYPVFFRFQGGKGVATAFGVVSALAWPVAMAMAATWLLVALAMRFSSLASVTTAVAAPAYVLLLGGGSTLALSLVPMSLLLLWRHRANITRLLNGTESRIGSRAGSTPAPEAPPRNS